MNLRVNSKMESEEELQIGCKYRHYKGGVYTVLNLATCSETLVKMVVYEAEDGRQWVRPFSMWFQEVRYIDKKGNIRIFKRFELVNG
jgi:hypothetical protein